jgi:hypothetical protein
MAGTAISITIDVDTSHLPTVEIDDDVIAQWIGSRLNDTRNTFIQHMSGGGGGRSYGRHTASAPGAYPATDSGRLAGSVDWQMTDTRQGTLDSDVEYAGYLTTGTTHMAPRKMLADALQEVLAARPETDELKAAVKVETK